MLCLPFSSIHNTCCFIPFKVRCVLESFDFNKDALLAAGEGCFKVLVVSDDDKFEDAEAVALYIF